MKTQLIDRSEEKLKIAQELGLESYTKAKMVEIQTKAAVEDLKKMSFKPITEKQVEAKICGVVFDKGSFDREGHMAFTTVGITLGTIFFIAGNIAYFNSSDATLSEALIGNLQLIGAILLFLSLQIPFAFRRTVVRTKMLSHWEDELPYGALLALKEAKERGIVGHENIYGRPQGYLIHYPVYASSEDRVKADPVITGMYKGAVVEIFAWDDRKVYE